MAPSHRRPAVHHYRHRFGARITARTHAPSLVGRGRRYRDELKAAVVLGRPHQCKIEEPVKRDRSVAKKRKRKYSLSAGRDVESEMRRYKRGTARSGRGGRGGKVKSRKQAIAIGLSKARKKGKKVPRKKR